MDGDRFDAAVRQATAASRRSVLGLALGGALLGLGGAASARKCRKRCGPCKRCKHRHCTPKPDGTACGTDRVCFNGICRLTGTCAGAEDYCHVDTVCGPVANDCRCFATVGGSSICALYLIGCTGCTSDAECGAGQACVHAGCGISGCPGNGNGCVQACPAKTFK